MSEPEANAQPETTADDRAPAAPEADAEPAGDALFEALWTKVVDAWDDDKAHAAILDYAVRAEKLPDLAGRYRAQKDDPAKGEKATKRLDAIIVAATQMMMSMKTPANVKIPMSITMTVFGLVVFALLFVAYAVFHRN